jgi:nucleotide-binding universal stress UspA family protein
MIRVRHILVVCEDSPDGDQALFAAAGLAQQMGAHLTVAAVADGKRSDDAARLRRAGVLLTDQPDLQLVTIYGERTTALIETATAYDCDLIVVPATPVRRLHVLPRRDGTRALRRKAQVPVLQTPTAASNSLARRLLSEPPAQSS